METGFRRIFNRDGCPKARLNQIRLRSHRLIAVKIDADPTLLQIPLRNLDRWRALGGGEDCHASAEWRELLELPWERVRALIVADTPFCAILAALERRYLTPTRGEFRLQPGRRRPSCRRESHRSWTQGKRRVPPGVDVMVDVLVAIADHRVMSENQLVRPKRVAEVLQDDREHVRLAAALPSKLQPIVADVRDRGLDHPVLKTLTTKLSARASYCTQILWRRSLPV